MMTNYTITSNCDITNLRISDGAYRLYNLLLSMAYSDKIQVYPSQKFMATALGRSIRTIQRYLKELVKNEYISIRRRGSTSNITTLLQKKVTQTVQKVKEAVKAARNAYNKHKKDNKNTITTNYPKKESVFNTFDQRNYDYGKLEKLLRGGEGELSDCLIE